MNEPIPQRPIDKDEGDLVVNPHLDDVFAQVVGRRLSRRGFLTGATATIGAGLGAWLIKPLIPNAQARPATVERPGFEELPHGVDEQLHVPTGYSAQVLLRWGDPLFPGLSAFDPDKQTAAEQRQRFGYNNDFVGFVPLPIGSDNPDHGLLTVNHEYTNAHMMFPGSPRLGELDREQIDIEIAAHGISVVEIERDETVWRVVLDSRYNRRLTANSEMAFAGPCAGHPRLNTRQSNGGRRCFGTINNCAGGITPWGTMLSGEENIQNYFTGDPASTPELPTYRRLGINGDRSARNRWGDVHERWNLDKEPLAGNHYGWIVEVDPYDPDSIPKKRTALGHFHHEGANVIIDRSGHAVAYSGDDQSFEYIYRFVSRGKFVADDRQANLDLLDDGVLSVAEFLDDGGLVWHPLVHGQGPLHAGNGFASQADVLIETRRAADLVGATPMDRPEDIEVNPITGSVFVMLTNNRSRQADQTSPANPRATNLFGHIVEILPVDGDHTAATARWDLFILAGDPSQADSGARYNPSTSPKGWFIAPDNCTFDSQGRLWIATDGGSYYGIADGAWVCDTSGPYRASSRHFLSVPLDAELCGPWMSSNDRSFFCAVQHPGSTSNYDQPNTRWPDFDPKLPPRPSVVVVSHDRGLEIGA